MEGEIDIQSGTLNIDVAENVDQSVLGGNSTVRSGGTLINHSFTSLNGSITVEQGGSFRDIGGVRAGRNSQIINAGHIETDRGIQYSYDGLLNKPTPS